MKPIQILPFCWEYVGKTIFAKGYPPIKLVDVGRDFVLGNNIDTGEDVVSSRHHVWFLYEDPTPEPKTVLMPVVSSEKDRLYIGSCAFDEPLKVVLKNAKIHHPEINTGELGRPAYTEDVEITADLYIKVPVKEGA